MEGEKIMDDEYKCSVWNCKYQLAVTYIEDNKRFRLCNGHNEKYCDISPPPKLEDFCSKRQRAVGQTKLS